MDQYALFALIVSFTLHFVAGLAFFCVISSGLRVTLPVPVYLSKQQQHIAPHAPLSPCGHRSYTAYLQHGARCPFTHYHLPLTLVGMVTSVTPNLGLVYVE